MKLTVGNKYQATKDVIVEIVAIKNYVHFEFVDGSGGDTMSKSEFEQRFEPYVEFKWHKITSLKFKNSNGLMLHMVYHIGIKPYELLYNYYRYRELVDTVELDWEDDEQRKWCIYGNGVDYYLSGKAPLDIVFSTKAHAQTFLKLAQENDCL
jgi:hypothetical protein